MSAPDYVRNTFQELSDQPMNDLYRPVPNAERDALLDKRVERVNPLVATPWKWVNPEDVAPREFLYGTH
jgi:hypothetical protein